MQEPMNEQFKVKGKELLAEVMRIVKEGNARRIVVQNDKGAEVFSFPVTIGVVGVLFAPVAAAIGALAALATDYTLTVVRKDP